MRLFIAIPISIEIKTIIQETLSRFKLENIGNLKIVEVQNLHLTLKFIGEYSNATALCDLLNDTLNCLDPFEMYFSKCGFFPTRDNPRVLWAGFGKGKERFTDISKKINKSLKNVIEPDTRKNVPHLTILRIKKLKNIGLLEELQSELDAKLNGIKIPVREIILFKSVLSARGPEYFELSKWPLN